MPYQWLDSIFLQAHNLGVSEIIPSTMGEPLLYQHIDKIFALAAEYNIKINLTTNGTFPIKDVNAWSEIIVPVTSDIKFSINGATNTTSEKIMAGYHFNETINKIVSFINYRNKYFLETGYYCRVSFQTTFMAINMHELSDIVKLAASLGVDRIKGHHIWTHFKELKELSFRNSKASIDKWNEYVSEAIKTADINRKPNGDKVILENIIPLVNNETTEVPVNYECPFLYKELWISATGKISPCCAPDELRNTLGNFGNISTHSLNDVLISSQYLRLANDYKNISLCKTCNMRKPSCN